MLLHTYTTNYTQGMYQNYYTVRSRFTPPTVGRGNCVVNSSPTRKRNPPDMPRSGQTHAAHHSPSIEDVHDGGNTTRCGAERRAGYTPNVRVQKSKLARSCLPAQPGSSHSVPAVGRHILDHEKMKSKILRHSTSHRLKNIPGGQVRRSLPLLHRLTSAPAGRITRAHICHSITQTRH